MILLVLGESARSLGQVRDGAQDCTSNVDVGTPCRDVRLLWYYNEKGGNCDHFFYGGCDGNDNRYFTQGICELYCMKPSNGSYSESAPTDDRRDCESSFDKGPCGEQNPRWYYNATSGSCESFNYGGCVGNDNRYVTKDLCESSCPDEDNGTGNDQKDCTSESSTGDCDGYFPRWFFNTKAGICERFTYGGCGGNFNRYLTYQQCEDTCKPTVDYTDEDCESQPDQGPCNQNFRRWFYNEKSDRCEEFTWGGCQGNANNYATKKKCDIACRRFSGEPIGTGADCTSNYDEGEPCRDLVPRYFFNVVSGRCEGFPYSGCEGNDNRYVNLEICEAYCMRNVNLSRSDNETPNDEKDCSSTSLHGSCEGRYLRWFFNTYNKKCEGFIYGGCGGNFNRYLSRKECRSSCYP